MNGEMGERKLVLWIPDWSIVALAASVPPLAPAVTVRGGIVTATTRTARIYGVRAGMRQSTGQQLCQELLVLSHDPVRDDSAFEGLLRVFDQVAADVCALRPGLAWAPLPSEARWGRGEEEIVAELAEQIAGHMGVEAYVGVGTGSATALAAARRGLCIPQEETLAFLDALPVEELLAFIPESDRQEYDQTLRLLEVLGIHRVLHLRQLGLKHLLTRFGKIGQRLWALAHGGDLFVRRQGAPIPEVTARLDFDSPVVQVDHALVGARRVAQDLIDQLERKGLHAQSISIALEGEGEVVSHRKWGLFNTASSSQVAQRIIWQIHSWQERTLRDENEPGGSLHAIAIAGVDLLSHFSTGTLWGTVPRLEKINRTIAQVQLLVGEEAVLQPRIQGGLDPRSRVLLQPWGKDDVGEPPEGEWAGAVREPPLILFDLPPRAKLIGEGPRGEWKPLSVDRRGALQGIPRRLVVLEDREELIAGSYDIVDFAGLWAMKGNWWSPDPAERISRCYLRLKNRDGGDLLLIQQEQQWYVEGLYKPIPPLLSPERR